MAAKRASDKPKSRMVFGPGAVKKICRAILGCPPTTNKPPTQIRALREYAGRRGWDHCRAGEGGRSCWTWRTAARSTL
jgi:hypothetical protein